MVINLFFVQLSKPFGDIVLNIFRSVLDESGDQLAKDGVYFFFEIAANFLVLKIGEHHRKYLFLNKSELIIFYFCKRI